MLEKNTLDLMKDLTQEIGVSGSEKGISKVLQGYYKNLCDEIIFDNLGSVFAIKKSEIENAKKVMICSHMDELGFMVKEIKDNGLIRVLVLGNIPLKEVINKRVSIVNKNGELVEGVISLIKSSKNREMDNLYIDIGAESKEEVINYKIDIGNQIIINGEFKELLDGKRIVSKAWDDRFGCVLGIEILRELKDVKLDFDLYVGCSVQNLVGLRGSITSTNLIKPDLAIVTDCLEANDIKNTDDQTGKLGDGLLVSYYDKSMMPNKLLLKELINICDRENIKYQYYYSMDESDGGWIHKLLNGCPTLKLSICARNLKSNSAIIDARDYLSSKEALKSVLKELNIEKIEFFKTENR